MGNAGIILRQTDAAPAAEPERVSADRELLERFTARRDEAAFAELVRRYRTAVWAVCWRVLRHEQDTEDAFQAVFLVLARRAASIRKGEAVGSWLYGVAYRTAMKARHSASRRKEKEEHAGLPGAEESPPTAAACRELQLLLDEEVQRLGNKLRAPFVLCCLQGLSKSEAARELGWREGTVSGRLAQARSLLRNRLARRGVALSAALTALALVPETAAAASATLTTSVAIQATLAHAAGNSAGLSPTVVSLAENLIQTMATVKIKAAVAVILALSVAVGGAALTAMQLGQVPAQPAADHAAPETFLPPPIPLVKPLDEQVLALAWSPDGKRLLTAGARHVRPGQIKMWDVDNGRELFKVRGINGARSVAFSPDGKTFVTGHFGGAIELRAADTGKVQITRSAHTEGIAGVNGLAYSADGTILASAGLDKTVKLWDAQTLRERKTFRGHTDMVFSVAVLGNGQAIVSGGQDKIVRVWDVATGKPKFLLSGHENGVETVAVSPNDKIVATGSWDRTIKLWDAATGTQIGVLAGHEGSVLALAFSPDGKLLASATGNGMVRIWDATTRKLLDTVPLHHDAIWSIAFSPDSKRLATGSSDRTAKIWDVAAKKEIATFDTSENPPIRALAYAPHAPAVAVTAGKLVHLRDPAAGTVLKSLSGHGAQVNCLAFNPEGEILASGSDDRTIKLWNKDGVEQRTLKGHIGAVSALAFSPDGKQLAAADQRTIIVWEVPSGKKLASFKGHKGTVRALAFTADGQTLVSSGIDRTIRVWYLDNQVEPIVLTGHMAMIRALAFVGPTLASAADDGTVKLWESEPGKLWKPLQKEPHSLQGHAGRVMSLVSGGSGKLLISGGADGTIIVWNLTTLAPRSLLEQQGRSPVTALASHPKGLHLISGNEEGGLWHWRGAGVAAAADRNAPTPIAAKQTKEAGNAQGGAASSVAPDQEPSSPTRTVWLALALAVAVALLSFVGVRAYRRRLGGRADTGPARDEPLSFTCPGCSKTLRAKPALAGKTCKCPNCGSAVDIPAAEAITAKVSPQPPRPRRWLVVVLLVCILSALAGAITLTFYQPRRSPVVGVMVGHQFVLDVEESGFLPQHFDNKGNPFRWTNGKARLSIPIDRAKPPRTLWMDLQPYRYPNYDVLPFLRIAVNDHELFHATVTTAQWKKSFDLSGLQLGGEVVVDIESDTFVPARVKGGAPDTRDLGVMVRGIKLLPEGG